MLSVPAADWEHVLECIPWTNYLQVSMQQLASLNHWSDLFLIFAALLEPRLVSWWGCLTISLVALWEKMLWFELRLHRYDIWPFPANTKSSSVQQIPRDPNHNSTYESSCPVPLFLIQKLKRPIHLSPNPYQSSPSPSLSLSLSPYLSLSVSLF